MLCNVISFWQEEQLSVNSYKLCMLILVKINFMKNFSQEEYCFNEEYSPYTLILRNTD